MLLFHLLSKSFTRLSCPDSRSPSLLPSFSLTPTSSRFNTSTSRGPSSSTHTAAPPCSLSHPALLSTPSFKANRSLFPSYHPHCLFLPTTPSAIPPSIRLSNGHRGRESPCSCLGQTLITHTVTLGWGHSHPFCPCSRPVHNTLYFLH